MKAATIIEENWDPTGIITASSDAAEEFATWQKHAAEVDEWRGDELTLSDFADYIEALRNEVQA
jgi:hypothetical protein